MADKTHIDVFESIVEELHILALSVETRWTIPSMGHLGCHEQMSLILSPFDYRHTVTLSLHDVFLY